MVKEKKTLNKSTKKKRITKNEEKEEIFEGQDIIEAGFGKILTIWFFPEFIKHERSAKWYIYFSAIMIILLVLSFSTFNVPLFKIAEKEFALNFVRNPLLITFIILFVIAYFWPDKKDPEYIPCLLTQNGLVVGDKFTEYSKFTNFYIIYQPPGIKNLYFQPRNQLKPRIAIPLEDQNPIGIRNILLKYIDEDLEKEEIPASEALSRILKI